MFIAQLKNTKTDSWITIPDVMESECIPKSSGKIYADYTRRDDAGMYIHKGEYINIYLNEETLFDIDKELFAFPNDTIFPISLGLVLLTFKDGVVKKYLTNQSSPGYLLDGTGKTIARLGD